MPKMGIDNRVATHEAMRAIESSGQRLENAMARSAGNARDAATLSKGEFTAEIANKAGIADQFQALDQQVFNTAANIAKGRGSGQVGASEIRQAVGLWKANATVQSKGDGFLSARDAAASSLKTIHAAAQKHEAFARVAAEAKVDAKDPGLQQGQQFIQQQSTQSIQGAVQQAVSAQQHIG